MQNIYWIWNECYWQMGDIKGLSKHRNPRKQAVTCEMYGRLSKQGEQHGVARGLWMDNIMLPQACEKLENRWLMYLVAQKAGIWATEKWGIRIKEMKKLFIFSAKYFPSLLCITVKSEPHRKFLDSRTLSIPVSTSRGFHLFLMGAHRWWNTFPLLC